MCPETHPFVYNNGDYCCERNREKVYAQHGALCDGSALGFDSKCCEDDKGFQCASPPCSNFYGNYFYCLCLYKLVYAGCCSAALGKVTFWAIFERFPSSIFRRKKVEILFSDSPGGGSKCGVQHPPPPSIKGS